MAAGSAALDLGRLGRGAAVAAIGMVAALLVAGAYDLAFYDAGGDSDRGIAVLMTEGFLFAAIVFLALPVAAFVSVWRCEARLVAQGAAAIGLDWAVVFLPAAAIIGLLVGGLGTVFQAMVIAAPFALVVQALAAAAAGVATARFRRRRAD